MSYKQKLEELKNSLFEYEWVDIDEDEYNEINKTQPEMVKADRGRMVWDEKQGKRVVTNSFQKKALNVDLSDEEKQQYIKLLRDKEIVDNLNAMERRDIKRGDEQKNLMSQVRDLKKDMHTVRNIMIFFVVLIGLSILGTIIWGVSFASNLAKMASMF